MLANVVLTLLQEIKENIVVDTGDGIKGIDAITLTEDGKGYVVVLEGDQDADLPAEQPAEKPFTPEEANEIKENMDSLQTKQESESKPGSGVVSEPAESESKPDSGVVNEPEKSQNESGSGVVE